MREQLALDFTAPSRYDALQGEHLERVSARIGRHILTFCQARIASGQLDFRMDELRAYVQAQAGVAPDSPSRILRDLRQQGLLRYEVVNRRASHYRLRAGVGF